MTPPLSRHRLLLASSAALAAVAGCATGNGPATESSVGTNSPDTAATTQTAATDEPRTTPSQPTTREPVGTGPNPVDFSIVNRGDEARTITIDVTAHGESTPTFERAIDFEPHERRRVDALDSDSSGTYFVNLTLEDGTAASYKWNVEERPVDGWVSVTVEADGRMRFSYAIA